MSDRKRRKRELFGSNILPYLRESKETKPSSHNLDILDIIDVDKGSSTIPDYPHDRSAIRPMSDTNLTSRSRSSATERTSFPERNVRDRSTRFRHSRGTDVQNERKSDGPLSSMREGHTFDGHNFSRSDPPVTRTSNLTPIQQYLATVEDTIMSDDPTITASPRTSRGSDFSFTNTSPSATSFTSSYDHYQSLSNPSRQSNTIQMFSKNTLVNSPSSRSRLSTNTRPFSSLSETSYPFASLSHRTRRQNIAPPPITCSHCLRVISFSISAPTKWKPTPLPDPLPKDETEILPAHIHTALLSPVRELQISGQEPYQNLQQTEHYFVTEVIPSVSEVVEMHIRLGLRSTSESSVLVKRSSICIIVDTLSTMLQHLNELNANLDLAGISRSTFNAIDGIDIGACQTMMKRVQLEIEKLLAVARSGVETLEWKERLVEAKERLRGVMDERPMLVEVERLEKLLVEKRRGLRERIRQRMRSRRGCESS